MVDGINEQVVDVAAPLTLHRTPAGIILGISGVPHLDLIELEQHLLAGKYDKTANLLQRDYAASSGDADQFAVVRELARTMDAWRSVWLEGHRGLALWLPNAGQRVPLPGFNFHIVELLGELTSGSSQFAKILTPLSGSLVDAEEASADIEIVVWDITTGVSTPSGTRCIVVQHPVGGKWWVVPSAAAPAVPTWAYIEFSVGSTFTVSSATFSATVEKIIGDTSVASVTDTVTVNNPVGNVTAHWFYGNAGDRGGALYDPSADEWNAITLECSPAA
jgi:hypothetical protein